MMALAARRWPMEKGAARANDGTMSLPMSGNGGLLSSADCGMTRPSASSPRPTGKKLKPDG